MSKTNIQAVLDVFKRAEATRDEYMHMLNLLKVEEQRTNLWAQMRLRWGTMSDKPKDTTAESLPAGSEPPARAGAGRAEVGRGVAEPLK